MKSKTDGTISISARTGSGDEAFTGVVRFDLSSCPGN